MSRLQRKAYKQKWSNYKIGDGAGEANYDESLMRCVSYNSLKGSMRTRTFPWIYDAFALYKLAIFTLSVILAERNACPDFQKTDQIKDTLSAGTPNNWYPGMPGGFNNPPAMYPNYGLPQNPQQQYPQQPGYNYRAPHHGKFRSFTLSELSI